MPARAANRPASATIDPTPSRTAAGMQNAAPRAGRRTREGALIVRSLQEDHRGRHLAPPREACDRAPLEHYQHKDATTPCWGLRTADTAVAHARRLLFPLRAGIQGRRELTSPAPRQAEFSSPPDPPSPPPEPHGIQAAPSRHRPTESEAVRSSSPPLQHKEAPGVPPLAVPFLPEQKTSR